MVLCVYPTADGYHSVRIRPNVDCYDLDWAKGTVPTPHGVITIFWQKQDGALTLDVTIPAGSDMACEVILPDGQTFAQTEASKQYVCKI
jgi:alpha-L-rhamnosidase